MPKTKNPKIVKTFKFNPISAACLTGRVEEVAAALEEHGSEGVAGATADETGWSPIHFASQRDHESVVGLLLSRGFSPLVETPQGNTALHLASQRGCLRVVRELLAPNFQQPQQLLDCKNKDGNTPLHFACEEGHAEIVQELLRCSTDAISRTNNAMATPTGLAIQNHKWEAAKLTIQCSPTNPAITFVDFRTHFPECNSELLLDREPMTVFVLGDVNSGRSTVIKSLEMQGMWSRLASTLIGVRNVDQHKIGIVPSTTVYNPVQNQKYRVAFYDLAGHCDYTHESIFAYTSKPLECIFIITVDMRDSSDESIDQKIVYWLNFLSNKCRASVTTPSLREQQKPKVIVVGSFADAIHRAYYRLNQICREIDVNIMSEFQWLGNYTMDCRKPYSWGMNQVRTILHDQCQQSLQESENEVQPNCYLLAALLESDFADKSYVSIGDLCTHVKDLKSLICGLLPSNKEALLDLCQRLHNLKHIVLLGKHSPQNWIVHKPRQLLADINDVLFSIHVLRDTARHGIVSRDSLKRSFPGYPTEFIAEFLECFRFCEGVNRAELHQSIQERRHTLSRQAHSEPTMNPTLPMFPRPHHHRMLSYPLDAQQAVPSPRIQHRSRALSQPVCFAAPSNPTPSPLQTVFHSPQYFFFPNLISTAQGPDTWKPEEKYSYTFAWSLIPSKGQKSRFFMPGFIHILLFKLVHIFFPSLQRSDLPIERQCTVWHHGVSWRHTDGISTCVIFYKSRAVTVSMRCFKGKEMLCLQYRNQIIDEIVSQKRELHPEIKVDEIFISASEKVAFPISDPTQVQPCYSVAAIRDAIENDSDIVLDIEGKEHQKLNTLLHFEPCCFLSQSLRKQLRDETIADSELSEDFCMELARCIGPRWKDIAAHFNLTEADISGFERQNKPAHSIAMDLIMHLKDNTGCFVTYRQLYNSLMSISIV